MAVIERLLQHPGYATKALREKGKFGKDTDIYALGMIGYVLRYGCFYNGQKEKDKIDRIFIRCMGKGKRPYLHIREVQRDLHCISLHVFHYVKKPFLHVICSCFFVFIAIFFNHQYMLWKEDEYHEMLAKEQYAKAIALFPDRLLPYQKAYEKKCNLEATKESCKQAVLEMERQFHRYNKKSQSDIARYFGMQCMRIDDRLFYQKAKQALSYVEPISKADASILAFYKEIAEARFSLKKSAIKQIEMAQFLSLPSYIYQQEDQAKKNHDILLYIQLFESYMNTVSFKEAKPIFDAITYLKTHDETKISIADQTWVGIMHTFALSAYNQGEIQNLRHIMQEMRAYRHKLFYMNDTMHRQYVFLYVLEFTNGIQDTEKKNFLFILDEAEKEWKQLEQSIKSDHEMLKMIHKLRKEWG